MIGLLHEFEVLLLTKVNPPVGQTKCKLGNKKEKITRIAQRHVRDVLDSRSRYKMRKTTM